MECNISRHILVLDTVCLELRRIISRNKKENDYKMLSYVVKIPSFNKIQKQIENLESEQAATVREKQDFPKKQFQS